MRKINFLFIGADRCGSKSMHYILNQHPNCFVPSIADPYFFDRKYDKGFDWYHKFFKNVLNTHSAIGELSHDYIHSKLAAQRIYDYNPNIKLVITLRNPIDRTYSSYASALSAGVINETFEQAIDNIPMFIENSLYADKLDFYFSIFKKEQIKVLFFDDLLVNPILFYKDLFSFLKLPFMESINYKIKKSAVSKSLFPFFGFLSKKIANILRYFGFENLLGSIKSNDIIRNIVYKPIVIKNKIDLDVQKKLFNIFEPQIERLEVILKKDLGSWKL